MNYKSPAFYLFIFLDWLPGSHYDAQYNRGYDSRTTFDGTMKAYEGTLSYLNGITVSVAAGLEYPRRYTPT